MQKIREWYAGVTLDPQQKFVVFIVLLGCVFVFNFGYELYMITRISLLSHTISAEALSLTKGVEATYRAMFEGRFTFNELLNTDETTLDRAAYTQKLEADFKQSIIRFTAYISAVKWGSESDAFKHSDGGLNYQEWSQIDLEDTMTIPAPSERQQQLAGLADVYFSGFASNAFRAISSHKKALRLTMEGDEVHAHAAEMLSQEYFQRSKYFFDLSFDSLTRMANDANASVLQTLSTIEALQKNARMNAIIVFVFGFLLSFLIVLFYTKNSRTLLAELDAASILLVRKDRELTRANQELVGRNRELENIGKTLIKRDLELSRSHERLLDLDELKTQFVSTAAHQLRTPLTGIRWSLDELLDGDFGDLAPEQKAILAETRTTNLRLINLVNDLLDVARFDEGRAGFDMKDDDIVPAVERAYEQYKKIAAAKGITFTLDVSPGVPHTLVDVSKLLLALTNLIDNAIKYTPPGGSVAVSVVADSKNILIHVSDNGIGVPENQRSRLFTRFFRAHNAILMETYGSGFGLSLVKNIIDKHGGIVEHRNREGGGSVFTLLIPIRNATAEKILL